MGLCRHELAFGHCKKCNNERQMAMEIGDAKSVQLVAAVIGLVGAAIAYFGCEVYSGKTPLPESKSVLILVVIGIIISCVAIYRIVQMNKEKKRLEAVLTESKKH